MNQKWKGLIALLCAMMLLSMGTALAEESRWVSVTGTATVSVPADQATLHIGVRVREDTVSEGQKEAAERIDAVLAALYAAGLGQDDISTESYSIYTVTEWIDQTQTERTLYQVYHMLNVRVKDLERAGEILDLAAQAGVNEVGSVEFSTSRWQEAYRQAMQDAVADTRSKAELLCAAAGVTAGDVLAIEATEGGYAYAGSRKLLAAEAASADVGTALQAGETSVTASVTVVYEIK